MKSNTITSIFIIDDDKLLTRTMKNELEQNFGKFNVEITTFESGEAVDVTKNNQPDVAIIDFHLNSENKTAMNGVKIIDMFRKKSPDTEIIMFTGEDNATIAVTAMHHGAHDYVVKDDSMFSKLNMAIYQCLKLKELKQELQLQKKLSYVSVAVLTLIIAIGLSISIIAPHSF